MARMNLGPRPSARCLNPKCKLTISWRHGQPAPKKCPACGYDKSAEDLIRIKAKLADAKARELDKRTADELASMIKQLPWYSRWALGLGLRKFPKIAGPGQIRVSEIATYDLPGAPALAAIRAEKRRKSNG